MMLHKVCAFQITYQLSWKIMKKADDQCSSITKDSIYCIKHTCNLLPLERIDMKFDVEWKYFFIFHLHLLPFYLVVVHTCDVVTNSSTHHVHC